MDRDKKDKLPNMQVGFIDSICMPVYQVSFKSNLQLINLGPVVQNFVSLT